MHIILWLSDQINPNDINKIISAEIPNNEEDPQLYELVMRHMIHGTCGSFNKKYVCMKENKCTKNFPKTFENHTQLGNDGYPKYRRRSKENGGNTGTIITKNHTFEVENR